MVFSIFMLRYIVIAGTAFLSFWVLGKRRFAHRRIQSSFPKNSDYRREFFYSALSGLIIACMSWGVFMASKAGHMKLYFNASDYGIPYLIGSILFFWLLHDAYFYWIHRFMHVKGVYKLVHRLHHESRNPSPWAAYAFHPIEAVLETALFPIVLVLVPMHYSAFFVFLVYITLFNVIGHLGYEFYPRGWARGRITKWISTATHHNMHHMLVHKNFGFYLLFWDRVMGTNHERYEDEFDRVRNRPAPERTEKDGAKRAPGELSPT